MKHILALFLAILLPCPTLAEPADPKAYIQMIYENKGGYIIPNEEIAAILKEGGHPQYGEITYESAAHILNDLNLSPQDVFYDLGSGIGKLILQVYFTTPVKRSIGIELSPTRWKIAESCRMKAAEDEHVASGRDLGFLNQNILVANLSDATVCFINGITFPPSLAQAIMNRLSTLDHEVKVISVLSLPPHKQFRLLKTYELPMSWSPEGVPVCLYTVTAPSEITTKAYKSKKRRKRQSRQDA